MSGHSAIMDSLREVGYRLTPQRMLIVSLIHDSKGHVTAEELHSRVVEQYPFVDISTVYRTLQLLKKLRLVSETDLGGGRVQYELTQEGRHHHLVCRQCGATSPLDDEMIEPLRGRLLEKHGFQADMEHFAIFGVCQKCAGKARAGGAGGRR
jgi:Fur family transcriptional regulator, ferric uptake regulator